MNNGGFSRISGAVCLYQPRATFEQRSSKAQTAVVAQEPNQQNHEQYYKQETDFRKVIF
jgi:hypothetical protein